jgi:hypothetical protein
LVFIKKAYANGSKSRVLPPFAARQLTVVVTHFYFIISKFVVCPMFQNFSFDGQLTLRRARNLVLMVLMVYIGLLIATAVDVDGMRLSVYQRVTEEIKSIFLTCWDFARPFVQVILFVVLLSWISKQFDWQARIPAFSEWKPYNMVVVLVVAGFVFAAVRGLGATNDLKDVALLVIGFFFGTLKKQP